MQTDPTTAAIDRELDACGNEALGLFAPTTAREYHADRTHTSRSAIEVFRKSRRTYKGVYVDGTLPPPGPSADKDFGAVSHLMVLQPHLLESQVRVIPVDVLASNGARSTNAWKAWRDEHAAFIHLKQEDFDAVRRLSDAVLAHDMVRDVMSAGPKIEDCITWQDEATGLMCKSLRDVVLDEFILDLKSCQCEAPREFARSAANFGYPRQDAFYKMGHRAQGHVCPRFIFIAAGKETGRIACHELRPFDVERAEKQIRRAMIELAVCVETDDWSNPWEQGVNSISLPKWAFDESWEFNT